MKKIFLSLAFALGVLVHAGAQKQLTVLHTNDTHSCIMPLSPHLEDTLLADRGGYLRRIVMIDSVRKANPDVLLFDSGDFSQGSPYYTLFKGDVEVELMNRMGYDAATIGNHEFDFGLDNMARIFKKAKFPILCANYDFKGTVLEGLVKPWIILKRKGVKIGVFGLDPMMDGLVSKNNYGEVKYIDPATVATQTATMLKKEKGCDVVICLSHLGWDGNGDTDQSVIPKTRNIDLVLGGHSHTYMKTLMYVKDSDGKEVPVDQNGKNAIYVGKMVIDLKKTHSK